MVASCCGTTCDASWVLPFHRVMPVRPWSRIHSLLARNHLQRPKSWVGRQLEVHEFFGVVRDCPIGKMLFHMNYIGRVSLECGFEHVV